ncbi:hypothetical protein AJ78_00466 [Emergomyces pasteurianus Ep9510]|uniref:Uncharacterized protein n=1 Tax=Emergomyces pasteurianus Ep9510 TaxID=1447872 RepID=A0A1J9PT69_9EURO|nr:hypothetical protein AJ78_00466 [Emergomyces pasteurianus Ep9510]
MTVETKKPVIATLPRGKGGKKTFKVTRTPRKRREPKADKANGKRELGSGQSPQKRGSITTDMRDELECRFYDLEFSRQIQFLECLRCNFRTACDYYEWVKMGVAQVHFGLLPGTTVKCLFRFLKKHDLLDGEPGAADEETKKCIRECNAETRKYIAELKEKVRNGLVDSGSL